MPTIQDMTVRVRASSTLPGLMIPPKIDGHTMYDGGLGHGAGLPVHMAEEAGYRKILFIATRPKGYRKPAVSSTTARLNQQLSGGNDALFAALMTRNDRYNRELERLERVEKTGQMLTIRPDVMPVSSTTTKRAQLEESYRMGRAQAERDWPRIQEFIFG
jgi:predicted patatin/cPLA2 family phospholipase